VSTNLLESSGLSLTRFYGGGLVSLQDEMRESILRAVLARPYKCPKRLVRYARNLVSVRKETPVSQLNIEWAEKTFQRTIARFSEELPDILAEDRAE